MDISWGINVFSHDASLAVLKNNEIVFASSSERFSKKKNDSFLNSEIINYALSFGKPTKVILSENKFYTNMRRRIYGQSRQANVSDYLKEFDIQVPICYNNHHKSHAAAGYYTSKFWEAAILIVDGVGEWDTLSAWKAEDTELKKVYSLRYPNSIGLFYSALTHRIGLKPNEEEYILMALSSFGDPCRFKPQMINDFFEEYPMKLKHNLHRGCMWWNENLKESDYADVAAATQSIYEDFLRSILSSIKTRIGSNNLILGGGCALNCTANRIAREFFNNVHIFFNPGDSGNSVGTLLANHKKHIKVEPFLGYKIKSNIDPIKICNELKKNLLCGIAQGSAEFGPRALGNRSLLGNPKDKNIIHKLNTIKNRQEYRPFALAILEERARDYFEMFNDKSPYMQYTYKGKLETMKHLLHKDGTSRIQTVRKGDPLYEILATWEKETGDPFLINTSLNIKGQPIVNDEADCLEFQKKYNVKVFS